MPVPFVKLLRRWPAAWIALLALALRLAWIAATDFQPTLNDDAGRYWFLGQSLAAGRGFVNPNGATTLFWPPGYPFLLAALDKLWPAGLFGAHELVLARCANAALGGAGVLLVYGIGLRAFDRRTALLGALITACFPSLVFFAGVTLSETAFTTLLLLAVWLLLESEARDDRRMLVAAGIVIGAAALVRGQALLLPVVAIPYWWRGWGLRTALTRAAATLALTMLVVAPWTIRNAVRAHAFVPIATNSGADFYIGHSAAADGRGRIVADLVFQYADLPPAEAEARMNQDGFRRGLRYAATHPLAELKLSARKLFWLYYADHEAVRWIDGHGERFVLARCVLVGLLAFSDLYYWAVLAVALAGIRHWCSWRDPARLLLLSVCVYWTLVHVAFFGDPRFHAPILPIVALWAAAGAWSIVERVSAHRAHRATPAPPTA
jgi:4-amino-4-deoxy-L-arabinose transferase-like glycosyltransferase